MNPIYRLRKSPYKFAIGAALAFSACILVGILMLGFGWAHTVVRLWLFASLIATAVLLFLAGREWLESIEFVNQSEAVEVPRQETKSNAVASVPVDGDEQSKTKVASE